VATSTAAGTLALALTANVAQPRTALAWGDDGHKVVAMQHLDSTYAARAEKDIALQLSKADVRLGFVVNNALRKQ
jgi:hypothetical protein